MSCHFELHLCDARAICARASLPLCFETAPLATHNDYKIYVCTSKRQFPFNFHDDLVELKATNASGGPSRRA